jgi:hypothetical protein
MATTSALGWGRRRSRRQRADSTVLLGRSCIDVNGAPPYAIPQLFAGRPPWHRGLGLRATQPVAVLADRMTHDLTSPMWGRAPGRQLNRVRRGPGRATTVGTRWRESTATSPYGCVMTGLVQPVYEYSHGSNNANCSITAAMSTADPIPRSRLFSPSTAPANPQPPHAGRTVTDVIDHTAKFGLGECHVVRRGRAREIYVAAAARRYIASRRVTAPSRGLAM